MGKPMRIKAAAKGGVTEVRVLMSHDMESGQRKDANGAVIPAHFITELVCKHNDKVVLSGEFGTAVSKDPFLQFKFKGGAAGDKVVISWKDSKGDARTDEAVVS